MHSKLDSQFLPRFQLGDQELELLLFNLRVKTSHCPSSTRTIVLARGPSACCPYERCPLFPRLWRPFGEWFFILVDPDQRVRIAVVGSVYSRVRGPCAVLNCFFFPLGGKLKSPGLGSRVRSSRKHLQLEPHFSR